MKRYDARRYDGDYVLYSDVEKMEQAHREEIAALTARCELYLRINKVHLDTILELTARCKRLEKHQSVCECGGYSKDHTIGDGHYPVDMVQPCPFAERCKRLEEALQRFVNYSQCIIETFSSGNPFLDLTGYKHLIKIANGALKEAGQ